eukprot:scaffold311179_cov14-Tisochrysis_lutea.AAC.1
MASACNQISLGPRNWASSCQAPQTCRCLHARRPGKGEGAADTEELTHFKEAPRCFVMSKLIGSACCPEGMNCMHSVQHQVTRLRICHRNKKASEGHPALMLLQVATGKA